MAFHCKNLTICYKENNLNVVTKSTTNDFCVGV